jgi:hypothetical protein
MSAFSCFTHVRFDFEEGASSVATAVLLALRELVVRRAAELRECWSCDLARRCSADIAITVSGLLPSCLCSALVPPSNPPLLAKWLEVLLL